MNEPTNVFLLKMFVLSDCLRLTIHKSETRGVRWVTYYTMKRYDDSAACANFAAARTHINKSILAILFLITYGCATPLPVTIKHESTPSLSDAALSKHQQQKESAQERAAAAPTYLPQGRERSGATDLRRRNELSDQGTASLLELLKSKKVISDEEAALITGQTTTGTGERSPAEQRIALLELLKSKKVISDEEAALITGQTPTGTAGEQGTAVESQKSVEEIKEEIRGEVTNELLRQVWTINEAMKEKDKRLRFSGDIRLRYEQDRFDKDNAPLTKIVQGTDLRQLQNSWATQNFFKYRVRFGAEAQVNEQLDAVLQVSTGSTSNPVSTNSTMGDYMNKDTLLVNLAYLKWQPGKTLTFYGGRMPNPWFSSDLVWARDLNFEGIALHARASHAESWTPFLTLGAFPLQQSDPVSITDFSQHSKWLYAGQTGLEKKDKKGISAKIGAAYYDYQNVTGVANDDPTRPGQTDWSAPFFNQKGNTLFYIDPTNSYKVGLASEFKELNVTGTLDIGFWDPVHIVFLGDYVRNIGFKESDVMERQPAAEKDITGQQIGVSVGYPAIHEKKEWRVYFYSKRLGADAVLDAFTDPDFHLGGTNAKGWIFGTDVGIARNMWMTLKWLTADEISGPPLAIDVLQVDLNAKF